jgi:hypothetical protein
MKRLITLLALVLAGCVVRVPPPVVASAPPVTVRVDTFDPYLDPYGVWIVVPGSGRVWQPGTQYVGLDFYPYGTGGHWVYTSAGWAFDNDYPFGWAVFHYGRWFRHVDHGWVWVPGNTWAPAWVSWRTGGTYVGWAPLGPAGELAFHHRHWCFVDGHDFTVINVRSRSVTEQEFHGAVALTSPIHGAVPVGPAPNWVAAATRSQIVPVPVNDLRSNGRVVPPPPPPGRVTASVPPPPSMEPGRVPPPPARVEPERMSPPPARYEPPPPPARYQPERLSPPPPARYEPERVPPPIPPPARFERTPAPPPRYEPDRLRMPPPARIAPGVAPAPPPPPVKKTVPPPPPPARKIRIP